MTVGVDFYETYMQLLGGPVEVTKRVKGGCPIKMHTYLHIFPIAAVRAVFATAACRDETESLPDDGVVVLKKRQRPPIL